MADKKKIPDNEDLNLAELEACRTGEEHGKSRITSSDSMIIEDLDRISGLFSKARPDPDDIPGSVDNFILAHIKDKSSEIRREQKVIWLFPRCKWAAAAVMGVLVWMVSFNLVYKKERPAEKFLNEDISNISPGLSKDIDGNGRVDIIDAYLMDRRLISGVSMPKKLDLNGDGDINREDVKTIVKTAVSLGRGEV